MGLHAVRRAVLRGGRGRVDSAGSRGRRPRDCGSGRLRASSRSDKVCSEEETMGTTELRVELPATLSQEEAKLLLAVKLFEVGKASLGQAAKMAELSKRGFMEILGRYGVPVFNYSPEELRTEGDLSPIREMRGFL